MSTSLIVFHHCIAAVASPPSFDLCQLKCCLGLSVRWAVWTVVVGSSTGQTDLIFTLCAFRTCTLCIEVLRCYPGTASWKCTINSIRSRNSPLRRPKQIPLPHRPINVSDYRPRRYDVKTTFCGPLSFDFCCITAFRQNVLSNRVWGLT